MQKGKIYKATVEMRKLKGHIHPIIILDIQEDSNTFTGAIISHESEKGNIALLPNHFCDNQECTIMFDREKPSFLIHGKFVKTKIDIQAKPFGELTPEGLLFVNESLKNAKEEVLNKPIWEREQ